MKRKSRGRIRKKIKTEHPNLVQQMGIWVNMETTFIPLLRLLAIRIRNREENTSQLLAALSYAMKL